MHAMARSVTCLLAAFLLLTDAASAARKGRLIGRALDPDGNPIEGVTVTATSAELPDFNVVDTTDDKGVFKVDFEEIGVVYTYRFQKVGYQTLEVEQNWQKDGSARYDFTMYPGEAATVEGLAPASTVPDAVTAFNSGVAAFDAKDLDTAIARFEEAVELDPELRQGWAALSVVLAEQQRWEEVARTADRAVELGSTHDAVLKVRWEAYRNLGDEAKAATALEDLERAGRAAEEAKRIFNEGVRLSNAGDLEGAFARFEEAAGVDPNLQTALVGVATIGLKIGRHDEAFSAAQQILTNDPGNPDAIRLQYNAALELGDEPQIAAALVQLAAVEPGTARDGLWVLARAANDANDEQLAKVRFRELLEIDPNHARANYLLGLILVSDGANDEAVSHLRRFIELAPDDPDAGTARELIDYLSSS